jgi:hypothetical protein
MESQRRVSLAGKFLVDGRLQEGASVDGGVEGTVSGRRVQLRGRDTGRPDVSRAMEGARGWAAITNDQQ